MVEIILNEEKNGIELKFTEKPEKEILDKIKILGFRWSNRQKIWYAKQTDERLEFTKSFSEITINTKKEKFDLWNATRTENIPYNFGETHEYNTKKIAATIRKHIKSRFNMCRWSITSDHNSISIELLESPFRENSDELNSIMEYAKKYMESWNYNNSDPYTDYFDYNFFGNCTVAWNYKEREMTKSEENMIANFKESKAKFDDAEKSRKEKEYNEYVENLKRREEEAKEREKVRKSNHEKIISNIEVKDVEPYFLHKLIDSWRSKEDSIEDYYKYKEDDENLRMVSAKITREIHMTESIYEIFSHQLLDDYTFLENMGGSETADNRIKEMDDYYALSENDKETVKWYSTNCIAVYCENKMMFIIDPQGYSYARYCFLIDEKNTYRSGEDETEQVLNGDLLEDFKSKAQTIEDVSFNIIYDNELFDVWNNEEQDKYIEKMKSWIYENGFKLNSGVVQQIENPDLKHMMYKILDEINSITEQFEKSGLKAGQKITIMRIDDFGGFNVSNVIFESLEIGSYAQYNKAVKMIMKPKGKRKLYYNWYYKDMIVVDGWVNIPENVLWDIDDTKPGYKIKKSKFLACDERIYDEVEKYLSTENIVPIVNTYNPDFKI